jgi:hypothetical protein
MKTAICLMVLGFSTLSWSTDPKSQVGENASPESRQCESLEYCPSCKAKCDAALQDSRAAKTENSQGKKASGESKSTGAR